VKVVSVFVRFRVDLQQPGRQRALERQVS
jgi:hypothetical protein